MSRLRRVIVTKHLCTLVDYRLEQYFIGAQLMFPRRAALRCDLAPHICDDDNVAQRLITAQLSEHAEIPFRNASDAEVRDAMHVNDTAQLVPALVPVRRVRSTLSDEGLHSRSGQIDGYHLEYIRVRNIGIVEARSIDEGNEPSFELEASTSLDVGGTGLQSGANRQVGAADEIDKLQNIT